MLNYELAQLIGTATPSKFSLSEIHNFPESLWHSKNTEYSELESFFNGDFLDEMQTQGGKEVEKYPIKLNPIRGAVYKHAYALFGETEEDSRPLAPVIFHSDKKDQKELAQKGQNFINRIWYNNHGRSLMLRNGILSQVYGGSILKASYVPELIGRKPPIRIESVHPANFVGVPMAGDEYRLEEAWIIRAISPGEANRLYNMQFPEDDELVYYVEYWNPEYYEITINGIIIPSKKRDNNGNPILYYGTNRFGAVPIVYTPHIRTTDFYGDSLISKNVQGIVKEMNTRVADYGDAVTADSHKWYTVSNVSGRPDVYELAPGMRVIQLPSNPSITGKEGDPRMEEIGNTRASTAMQGLTTELYDHFRREAFIPAVADGEDEGSQRSSLTLALRMWPLFSHTSMERVYWGDALSLLDSMVLDICKQLDDDSLVDITRDELEALSDMRIERRWAPVLPKDREVFINELVQRASAKLGTIPHLLSLLDDIEDPEGEYEALKNQIRDMASIDTEIQKERMETAAKLQPKPAPDKSGAQAKQAKQKPPIGDK